MSGAVHVKRFDRGIIDGPLLGAVWKLAWPTMLRSKRVEAGGTMRKPKAESRKSNAESRSPEP